MSYDLFIVHIPKLAANEGGYVESAEVAASYMNTVTSYSNIHGIDFKSIIEETLRTRLHIPEIIWSELLDGKNLEVKFCVLKERTEFILQHLIAIGVGESVGSVWVTPLDVVRGKARENFDGQLREDSKFINTIKARLNVEKVIKGATESATFSFDYCCLVIIASCLALLGLVYNNVVVIVASMLVSPIMGPIVAVTFGTVVRDLKLVKTGLYSESISLMICIIIGFVFGMVMSPFRESLGWPTEEMIGRGTIKGLISGILVAIPSGVGVALSILGNNTSSLVGVAISASLLPPAVNSGLLAAISILEQGEICEATNTHMSCIEMAGISFLLCFANILAIFITSLGMFKVKEVAPIPGKTLFWKEDVKLSREYKDVLRGEEAEKVAERIKKLLSNDSSLKANSSYSSLFTVQPTEASLKERKLSTRTDLMSMFDNPAPLLGLESDRK